MKEWDDAWKNILLRGYETKAGQTVSPTDSLQSSVVYACVKVISETIASLPLFVYRRVDGGKEPATNDYRFRLLHDRPNNFQTSFEWKEMLSGHACLRGNHVSHIKKATSGKIISLDPLNPTYFKSIDLDPATGKVIYTYTPPQTGKAEYFFREELVHIKLFSEDGLWGLSPIELSREAIGLALGTEEYAARFFSNDARPGGILEHPGHITEDAAKRLKKQWDEAHAGASKAHGTVVLEEGLKYHTLGLSNEDSQFLESRGFQVEEICRIFRVPAVLVGHPNSTMTYASAEQFFLSFVTHTVRPWLVRIEQVLNNALFSEEEQAKFFCEFKLDSLMRGDTLSRYQAYAIAIQNEWMCPDEARAFDNMNPRPDGKGGVYKNPAINPKPSKDGGDPNAE